MRAHGIGLLVLLSMLGATRAAASEIGHFAPGIANIRDYVVPPEPGVYGFAYTYYYTTSRLNDRHGDEIDGVDIRLPRRTVRLALDVDVDLYVVAPGLMWVTPWTFLGAKYAAYVLPAFANTSVGAALAIATGRGVNVDTESPGVGDLYVQPVWLGWGLDHFDFAFGMGFYAPIGKYDVRTVTLPRIGARIEAESADNIGLGFWTQQTQLAGTWYPWVHKATAVALALTHEVNTNKRHFDLVPGQNLALNWGVSQYVPLTKDQSMLLEIGPAGYDSWQMTSDSGANATSTALDRVHGVGGQGGLTYVPWTLLVNFHYFHEYDATDRFRGESFGVNVAKKF